MDSSAQLRKYTLIVTVFSTFLNPFMLSGINVALPAIQKEFGASAVALSWVSNIFLLAQAVVMMPLGKAADLYGRKKVFTLGMAVFGLSSFLAGFSTSITVLIALRVGQGLGMAMVVTTGLAILTSVFPAEKRGSVLGLYAAAVYIGLSIGPFVGGLLTQHLGWRSIFWLISPLTLVALFMIGRFMTQEWKDEAGGRFDALGSGLYGLAIAALIYGASLLPRPAAAGLMGLGLAGLAVFVLVEARQAHPVLEISLFRHNQTFVFSGLAALINYAATFAVTFLVSLYLQYIKGLSPQQAGLILIAQPIMQALFSPLAGRLSDRIEPRILASVGMAVTALGLFQLVLLKPAMSVVYIAAILLLLGFGFALFSSPNMSAIMGSVQKKHYGLASGVVATMRLLGQMLSMTVTTVVFAVFLGREAITPATFAAFLRSTQTILVIFTLFCLTGIFFSLIRGRLTGRP
ncbi:MAG: MFS transporter [Thermodesulfobacteriota bacterium]